MIDTTNAPRYDDIDVGLELPSLTISIDRLNLVTYAGASGDFNPIHWNENAAREAGLDNVIAHGMLTMGRALCIVTRWIQNPALIKEYSVRFLNPLIIADGSSTVVQLTAAVEELLSERMVRLGIQARAGTTDLIGRGYALVQLR